jgi:hypothetical protein
MREDAAWVANQWANCATAMIWCKPPSPSTLVGLRSPTPPWEICRASGARPHSYPLRNSAQQCDVCNLPRRVASRRPVRRGWHCCCLCLCHRPPSSSRAEGAVVPPMPMPMPMPLSAGALRAGRHGSRCRRTLSAALANVMMEALAQHTHGVKDGSEDMLAKNHRAGGAGAGHGCGAGVSSELTAVLKHRPMAKPPYFSPMHTAPDFPVR